MKRSAAGWLGVMAGCLLTSSVWAGERPALPPLPGAEPAPAVVPARPGLGAAGSGSSRFGKTAGAAAVRTITAEEASACASVLQTLRLAVKTRSLPTLQQLVTPALWGSITRDAGQELGSPEFFRMLDQELRERQPDPARDLYLMGLVQGSRLVLVFIVKAPAPTAEDGAVPAAAQLPTVANADEPIRACQVLFEREAKSGRWQLSEARFRETPGDYLRGEEATAEMSELYKWAKFVGDPTEAPNPYTAKTQPLPPTPIAPPPASAPVGRPIGVPSF